jgi:hypothetical protein
MLPLKIVEKQLQTNPFETGLLHETLKTPNTVLHLALREQAKTKNIDNSFFQHNCPSY